MLDSTIWKSKVMDICERRKRTTQRKAAVKRPGVLLNCKEALFFWEDLPIVFLALIVKTIRDAIAVVFPAADHIVRCKVVYGPVHMMDLKYNQKESRC